MHMIINNMMSAADLCLLSLFLLFSSPFLFLGAAAAATPTTSTTTTTTTPASASSDYNISAVFAFGDSTLDPGNNNNLLFTTLKANHAPYGQDYTGGTPTGRFSNGKLITDFLVSYLGLKDVLQPFVDSQLMTTADLLTGVSFASAGSGLHNLTAFMSATMPIEEQVANFDEYVKYPLMSAGAAEGSRVLADALFVICAGSNDMIMHYYKQSSSSALVLFGGALDISTGYYHDFLLQRMTDLVQGLHALGGRKFMIAGLPPLGCIPLVMSFADMARGLSPENVLRQRSCVARYNMDARAYNAKLYSMITSTSMRDSLPGTKLAYVDLYNPLMSMITYPTKYGFVETKLGCCGSGATEMGHTCLPNLKETCKDPSKYLFWDSLHPSHVAYKILSHHFMRTIRSKITK